ncbi:MAG: hypothetical protein AAFR44_03745 [Pseudomonadota bacterium]
MSGSGGPGNGDEGEERPEVVPLIPRLDTGLTDYDRRLVALAEKSVDEAMKKQPTWLTKEQREAIRYEMMVDLLIDPRGMALLESLVDGPEVDESDKVDRAGRLVPLKPDESEGTGGGGGSGDGD